MFPQIQKFFAIVTLLCCLQTMPGLKALYLQGIPPSGHSDQFYYFAYGSNMLGKRLRLQNPTAVKVGSASLQNYRLDFDQLNTRWRGARATIVPAENSTIFGVLWLIDEDQLENLDKQEGVQSGIYAPTTLTVSLVGNSTIIMARTYYLAAGIPKNSKFDRRPSRTYLKCFVKGAQDANLPDDYINYLKRIEHNGISAPLLEKELNLENFELLEVLK